VPSGVHAEQQGPLRLLVHPDAARWAVVNSTGLQVARLCDGRRTVDEISASIASTHNLDPDAVERDVQACLQSLGQAGFLSEPRSRPSSRTPFWRLHLYLTERCNLSCLHCGVIDHSRHRHELSTEAIRAVIDQAIASGADGIAFSGGEPLVRDDCLDLLAYSARLRETRTDGPLKCLLSTNATLIDHQIAARLARLDISIQVSLDGATAVTHDIVRGEGAFNCTWRGIAHLQRAGLGQRLTLNVTLMQPNLGEAKAVIDLAARRGIPGVRFFPLQHMGRAAEHWSVLSPGVDDYAEVYHLLYSQTAGSSKTPKAPVSVSRGLPGLELEPPEGEMWCRLGHLLLVDSVGDIYPCALLTAPQFRLGNVSDTSLEEALASEKLQQLVAVCHGRKDEIAPCQACTWRHFCQASCPGSVWLQHGTWQATDGLCDLRRELFRSLIFDRVKRYQQFPAARRGCASQKAR
jgi:radical SAM protein with 4Fe4S-binding SPASM domain